jgi:peptide/nickel transport system substrate-binding protein
MRGWLWSAALALALAAAPASAKPFRWANDNDVRSLDPYAGGENFLRSFDANIYEPLLRRGRSLALEPALATSWSRPAPDRWRFRLRSGVAFQDGAPFTADDVVFSFDRVRAPGSKIAGLLAAVREVKKIDDRTIEIATNGPDPLLLDELAGWAIMSRAWCLAHDAAEPADAARNEENYAGTHADGTGPFRLVERVAGERTVLAANPHWWDKPEHNLDRVVFTPRDDPQALADGLINGDYDMIYTVPPQQFDRIARTPGLRIVEGPELRTIFLGFDQGRDALIDSDVKGRNPFRDRRVRQAVSLAIDEPAILAKVMRGHATPAALLVGPGVTGFDAALDRRQPYDPAAAQKLLADAGYPNGFAAGMDCPTDRYVNDKAICEAVVAMLAKIKIKLHLQAERRAQFFAKVLPPVMKSDFFLMGWAPPTYDAQNVLVNLAQTRNEAAHEGDFNSSGYSNPALDALVQRIRVEPDLARRTDLLRQALSLLKNDFAFIPLHQQNVIWATRADVELVQRADNSFALRYVRMK